MVMMLLFSVVGCQKQEETAEPKTEEKVVKEEKETPELVIGEESDDTVALTVTNKTGKDIAELFVKASSEKKWGENLMEKDAVFKKDSEAIIHVANGDKEIDISPVFADEKYEVYHNVAVKDMEDLEFVVEGDLAYIKYVDKTTGKTATTKEYETELVEKKKAEKAAKAEVENTAENTAVQAASKGEEEAAQAAEAQAAAQAAQAAEAEAAAQAAQAAAEQAAAEQAAAQEAAPAPVEETPQQNANGCPVCGGALASAWDCENNVEVVGCPSCGYQQ